jgi:prepilin-type N-terminal cleavage/methylation domain-containing protein
MVIVMHTCQLGNKMKKQTGFTLIELAIVLVIIGLLLGGVLKGQELINSAKVKNLAADFRNVPVYIYGYQDKFKAMPGDDDAATTHLGAAAINASGANARNGVINGVWDSNTPTDESILFWQHVRLAGLAPGSTVIPAAEGIPGFVPTNSNGGRIGVSSTAPIQNMPGTYFMCSSGIDAKFALQIDTTIDDGNTTTGSIRATATTAAPTAVAPAAALIEVTTTGAYTVCQSF